MRLLERVAQPHLKVFEYGAGNSSLWWAARVAEVVSVEHDAAWAGRVAARAPKNLAVLSRPIDAPADPEYAKQLAQDLAAVGHIDVISSGRTIDIGVAKGNCDATMPKQALVRHTGASMTTLLAHGVLVVRCHDHDLQFLQSMRDADDVLCVHR